MSELTTPPKVGLSRGLHVSHLFYRIDRAEWAAHPRATTQAALRSLVALGEEYSHASNPRLATYVNVGGKADLVVMLYSQDLRELGLMHRRLEACFPPGTLVNAYSYLSVTEIPEYVSSEEDLKRMVSTQDKLEPGTEAFEKRLGEVKKRQAEYEHYRLYPEMPDWEIMCFYGMSKKRAGADNWYMLDFDARKKLMASHAKTGRKYAGRISQLITGSSGLDDWEWGVTLMAHQLDAVKEIVYEMRFDEVSARYGDFGPFYINLRMSPAEVWAHLGL